MRHRPFALVVSGPSGAGKDTVLRRVVQEGQGLWLSVSTTSRPPRPGEKDGLDYFFTSHRDFKRGIEEGRFLEWAEVFGHYYGTPKKPVLDRLARGVDVILNIDVQGAKQVKGTLGEDGVFVFLFPPSGEELSRRLVDRGTEDGGQLSQRVNRAKEEIKSAGLYDYWVINDTVESAARAILAIIGAERCSSKRLSLPFSWD